MKEENTMDEKKRIIAVVILTLIKHEDVWHCQGNETLSSATHFPGFPKNVNSTFLYKSATDEKCNVEVIYLLFTEREQKDHNSSEMNCKAWEYLPQVTFTFKPSFSFSPVILRPVDPLFPTYV